MNVSMNGESLLCYWLVNSPGGTGGGGKIN